MPAKDLYHDTVIASLIKDSWTITDDPLILKIGTRNALVDLGAEKLIAAQRDSIKIAVEVKTFISPSLMSDLEKAWGQFFLYSKLLRI
ncbi:element excision factor XisH family protein [Mastigocoleus testarum]|uniref:element excision factor XisH family protein n=1 Tax=Mastigocoleus testarum TaxID=996925 RepID=UPI0009E6B482|nr:element excision factor XisH family protein [Mastigocoleus testarum]